MKSVFSISSLVLALTAFSTPSSSAAVPCAVLLAYYPPKVQQVLLDVARATGRTGDEVATIFYRELEKKGRHLNEITSIREDDQLKRINGITEGHGLALTISDGGSDDWNVFIVIPPRAKAPAPAALSDAADSRLTRFAGKLAQAYGEDTAGLKAALIAALRAKGLDPDQAITLIYTGALESLPPQHQVTAITPDQVRHTLSVVLHSAVRAGPAKKPISEAALDQIVSDTSQIYREDAAQIRTAILEALQAKGVKLEDVTGFEHRGAFESIPPQHQIVAITRDGGRHSFAIMVPREKKRTISAEQVFNTLVDLTVAKMIQGYREDPAKTRAALLEAMQKKGIQPETVTGIDYGGALESMPPQHQISVVTRSGIFELSVMVF